MEYIYVDGVFDLFHPGHIAYLKKVKKLCSKFGKKLLVGIISDSDCMSYKRCPILTHQQRYILVSSCKIPDLVLKNVPLILTEKFIRDNGIDLVVHADDDQQSIFYELPIKMGIMNYLPYTQGISTTEIINKIKNF